MTQTEEERKKDKELEAGESQVVSEKSLLRHSFFIKKSYCCTFRNCHIPSRFSSSSEMSFANDFPTMA